MTHCLYTAQGEFICNNKQIEHYQDNEEEHFVTTPEKVDCYGVQWPKCNTCNDVKAAYKSKNWALDENNIKQCVLECGNKIKTSGSCDTCANVKKTYDNYNSKNPKNTSTFNAKNVNVCRAPNGDWKNTCRYGVVEKDGKFGAECKYTNDKNRLAWPAGHRKNYLHLMDCPSNKLTNKNSIVNGEKKYSGVLTCMQ